MRRLYYLSLGICVLILAGCEEQKDKPWLGYVVGESAMIAAPEGGWLAEVKVRRGDMVRMGDVLFVLDDERQKSQRDEARASLAQAGAQMQEARAQLTLAEKELARQAGLARANAGVAQLYDAAKTAEQQARARIALIEAQQKQAEASLGGAGYDLSQRVVQARLSGQVEDVYFRKGEYAGAMTPVVSVLPPENIYVRFFVPESEFAQVKQGQSVAIQCDGCAEKLSAKISFISQIQEFSPPVIFAAGSRERLVYKLEARIEGGLKLNPGQPVEIRPLQAAQ